MVWNGFGLRIISFRGMLVRAYLHLPTATALHSGDSMLFRYPNRKL